MMNNNMNFDPMTGLPLNKNLIDDEQQLQKEQQIIHEDINYIPANDSNHEEEILNETRVYNTSILNESYEIVFKPLIIRI